MTDYEVMTHEEDDESIHPWGERLTSTLVGWQTHDTEYVVEFACEIELQVKLISGGSVYRWVSSNGVGVSLWETSGLG